jgi:hypothetical protein
MVLLIVLSIGLWNFTTKINEDAKIKTELPIVNTWRDEPVIYNGKGILGTEIYSVYQLTNAVIRYPHDFTDSNLMKIESEVKIALSFAEQEGATDEIKGELEQALTLSELHIMIRAKRSYMLFMPFFFY